MSHKPSVSVFKALNKQIMYFSQGPYKSHLLKIEMTGLLKVFCATNNYGSNYETLTVCQTTQVIRPVSLFQSISLHVCLSRAAQYITWSIIVALHVHISHIAGPAL